MEVQCHILFPELLFCFGRIKEINVYYSVSKGGNEGYLYFMLNKAEHYICKRTFVLKGVHGYDECNLLFDTMIGGKEFEAFMKWWYSNDIHSYKISKNKFILNEKIASRICYHKDILEAKKGHMTELMILEQNIYDFEYIMKQYLIEAKQHIHISIVQLHMGLYYYFEHLPTNTGIGYEQAKLLYVNKFGITDRYDILKRNAYKMSHWEDNPYDSSVKK